MKVRDAPVRKDGVCLRPRSNEAHTPTGPPGKPSALRGKRLFLDLKGFKNQSALENNLKRLGAVIEKCFSKEVEWLVTSQGKSEDYKRSRRSDGDIPDYAPSPFNLGQAGIDSPQAPSPSSCQPAKPMTRGKAIAQAANLTKTYGSSNLVDNARKWGVRIVHIETAKKWVDHEIARYHEWMKHASSAEKKNTQVSKVKRLKEPFLKFEAVGEMYRPVYEILSELPTLHSVHGAGGCPFETKLRLGRSNKLKQVEEPAEVEERDIIFKDQIPLVSSEKESTKHTGSVNAGKCPRPDKKLAVRPQLVTAGDIRRRAVGQAEKQTGYCEMCNLRYENIDKHVLLDQHKKYVKNTKNYKALDAAIQENLTMVEVINELLTKKSVVTPQSQPINQSTSKMTLRDVASANSPKSVRTMDSPSRKKRINTNKLLEEGSKSSPKRPYCQSPKPMLSPCTRARKMLLKEQASSGKTSPLITLENVKTIEITSDNGCISPATNTCSKTLKTPKSGKSTDINLLSPRSAQRRSARHLHAATTADVVQNEAAAKTPASHLVTPDTPCSSRSGRYSARVKGRLSLRNQVAKEETITKNTLGRKTRNSVTLPPTEDQLSEGHKIETKDCSSSAKCENEVVPPPLVSLQCTPKKDSKRTRLTSPEPEWGSKQSTPMSCAGSARKTRKLILKKAISLASDLSMQKLLADDEGEEFEGFGKKDLEPNCKASLSYELVKEVEVDVDTMSDKEWDYSELEELNDEKNGGNEVKPEEEEDPILDLGSVIQSIGNIGEQSEGDWDNSLQVFLSDQWHKKQDTSQGNLNVSTGQVLPSSTKDTPLDVVLTSPNKAAFKPDSMFVYLSPRENKNLSRKLIISPVKLSKSPGKLIWSPKQKMRKPLLEMNAQTQKHFPTEKKIHLNAQGRQDDRQRFLRDFKYSSRSRLLSPSSGSVLSPSVRSRSHRSLFTSPSEFEAELWSGPATDDKSKFAKEGSHYKPSTPKLSATLKENKSSTPKSYLRHFRKGGDSEGERKFASGSEFTPHFKRSYLLKKDLASTSTSSAVDTSIYNIDDVGNDEDVHVDEDISFNFCSPQKTKIITMQRLEPKAPTKESTTDSEPVDSGQPSSNIRIDWLDDLDDPNLGNEQAKRQKSFFKHSPRSKKYDKYKYAAMPHWIKKYSHLHKLGNGAPKRTLSSKTSKKIAKISDKEKSARPERITWKASKTKTSVVSKCRLKERVSFKCKDAIVKEADDIDNCYVVPPKKKKPNTSLSLDTSKDTSHIVDTPVSPKTRRNLLSLVVGIRQHNKVPSRDDSQTSRRVLDMSHGQVENGSKLTEESSNLTTSSCKDDTQTRRSVKMGNLCLQEIEKSKSLRVSLKRLPSPVSKRSIRKYRRISYNK